MTAAPQSGRLHGAVALVVGGCVGVGSSLTRALVAEGATVVTTASVDAVHEGTLLTHELGPPVRFELLDVHDERHWSATLADCLGAFGRLDLLFLVLLDAASAARGLRIVGPTVTRAQGVVAGICNAPVEAVRLTRHGVATHLRTGTDDAAIERDIDRLVDTAVADLQARRSGARTLQHA
jgi:NAD(P)-dependent dehydrogenase (short-subunit alcohol dehydrogenase family)